MLTRQNLKDAFGIDAPEPGAMQESIDLWGKMYINQSPWLNDQIQSLNLAAAIASEVSRAITVEAKATVTGQGQKALFLQGMIDEILVELREQSEYAVALGGMVFKPFIDEYGRISIQYVRADSFYPVEFDSDGNLVGVVFVEKKKVGDVWFTKLEYHQMEMAGCRILNSVFRSSSEQTLGTKSSLAMVPEWADIAEDALITGVEYPLFAYFRYPGANNIDVDSKLGTSCYSRAVEMIEDADRQWSNFLWEFESGQRALYVDVLAFQKDPVTNQPILPNRRLYRTIDAGGQEDALFEDWSPTFRQVELLAGLDAILKRIEFAVGLAYGTLSDPASVEKTATEIAASKQRTYAMVTDAQTSLRDSLERLLWAVDMWGQIAGVSPAGTYAIAFDFDDSIIVDKKEQFTKDLQLVSAGIMSKLEWRMRNFGEDELTAKQALASVVAETPAVEFPM